MSSMEDIYEYIWLMTPFVNYFYLKIGIYLPNYSEPEWLNDVLVAQHWAWYQATTRISDW